MRASGAAAALRRETRAGATALTATAGALLVRLAAERAATGRLTHAALADDARALVRAQPAMASICWLADAVLRAGDVADAALRAGDEPDAGAVAAAVARFEAALGAAAAAVEARAAALVPDEGTVLTLSASSLVERALGRAHREGRAFRAVCLEARPRREGAALDREPDH